MFECKCINAFCAVSRLVIVCNPIYSNYIQEILQLVMIKNLDTGECKPLSEVETIAPKGTDPISMHIMKLTSDFGR